MKCSRTLWQRTQTGLVCMMLVACGGGGAGDQANAPQQPQQLTANAEIAAPAVGVASPSPETSVATGTPPQPVTLSASKQQERIGVNLSGILDYSATHEFVNLMHQSRRFGPVAAPWQEDAGITLDPATGWPTQDFGTVLWAAQAKVPGLGGKYAIRFKGPAGINVSATGGVISDKAYNSTTKEYTASLTVAEWSDTLMISFTNTQGALRDLKVIRPGYDAANPPTFTKEFLAHLPAFSTLRFMDWMETNSPHVATTWAKRPTPANKHSGTQAGVAAGQPWERAVELANTTSSHMWINIPFGADADYIRELARLIKKTLAPNLKVYVEYSNEVWNPMFPAFAENKRLADLAIKAEPKTTKIDFDGQTSEWLRAYRHFAELNIQASDIFRSEFPEEMMTRIRPVLAWQVAGPDNAKDMLEFIRKAYGKRAGEYFYAYAGAPYFAMGASQKVEGLSTTQVLDALNASVQTASTDYWYEFNAMLTRKHGMKWIAYEGGPDTFGAGSQEAKAQANREERMYNMCTTYLNDWNRAGGELFMWFTAGAGAWNGQYGSWPLLESISASDTPKMRCLTNAASKSAPQFAGRLNVGSPIDTADTANGYNTNNRIWWDPKGGDERDYLVGSPSTSCYKLTLTTQFIYTQGPRLEVDVNGIKQLTLDNIPMSSNQVGVNAGNLCLKAGANAITLRTISVAGSGNINSFRLDPL